ncbi:RHS repeat-associated core domain-containing protein [Pseudomonas sp. ZT5P21]
MPNELSSHAHTGTPTIQVSDARGLLIRAVQFHRREAVDPIDTRVTEQRYDAVGRLLASRDPRLFDLARIDASTPFNLSQVTSLSGVALSTDSVDAGWRAGLQGEAGQGLESWDGRGSHSLTEYDHLLRPLAVRERGHEVAEHALERFTYADANPEAAARNLCGQLVRHDDPAGTVHVRDLGLSGNVLRHTRHFLLSTDAPDWPLKVAERDALLEPGVGATTSCQYAPTSELLQQTDALGNRQASAYTVAGQLKNTRLTLADIGQAEKLLVSDLRYNAINQVEAETAGNGVVTRHFYDDADGRLTELSAHKADGTPLQHQKYQYDAVGNVLSIEDAAQPIHFFKNQRIEPIKLYQYDTLGQLLKATGCEAATGSGGGALPELQPLIPDPNQIAHYTQTLHYDAAGNLLDLVHVGAQAQGRTLTRARYSNRCLPERDGRPPTEDELTDGFDANGNLLELQPAQRLNWNLRNQLSEVRLVLRDDSEDDRERYIYDAGGQRVRKVHWSQTNARTLFREVRYLPGLEIRSHSGTGEILHVITAGAGSNSVRVLHWAAKPPDEIAQDQVRYNLNDQVKSCTLELDQQASVISWELFYAFGGTSLWAGRNAVEAKYKTVRYSGKERDATGLYYYGFRYYASWLARWINPDPAGQIDGPNLYRMVRNNPVALHDPNGLSPEGKLARKMIKEDGFLEAYAQNPKLAIRALRDVYSDQPHDTLIAAIERIKVELSPRANTEQRKPAAALKQVTAPTPEFTELKTFNIIYGTNIGSQRINNGMRTGSPIKLRGRDVVKEIQHRHGDDALDKKTATDVRFVGSGFDLEDAASVNYQLYKQSSTEMKTYYRGQDISEKGMKKFQKAKEKGTVLYSKSFLSVDRNEEVARTFMHGEIPVLMEITGFSAANVISRFSYEKDLVFTIHADFQVTEITKERGSNVHVIKLKEIRGFTEAPHPMPH